MNGMLSPVFWENKNKADFFFFFFFFFQPNIEYGKLSLYERATMYLLVKTRAVGGQRARLLGTFYIVTFLSLSHII